MMMTVMSRGQSTTIIDYSELPKAPRWKHAVALDTCILFLRFIERRVELNKELVSNRCD